MFKPTPLTPFSGRFLGNDDVVNIANALQDMAQIQDNFSYSKLYYASGSYDPALFLTQEVFFGYVIRVKNLKLNFLNATCKVTLYSGGTKGIITDLSGEHLQQNLGQSTLNKFGTTPTYTAGIVLKETICENSCIIIPDEYYNICDKENSLTVAVEILSGTPADINYQATWSEMDTAIPQNVLFNGVRVTYNGVPIVYTKR